MKHALQKLAKVDFSPDVKVMMGIFYAELAMLVYEDHRPYEHLLPCKKMFKTIMPIGLNIFK